MLHVLTQQDLRLVMWSVADGRLTRVAVSDVEAEYVSQAGAGTDGLVRVALSNGEGGVWRIRPDGSASRETVQAAGSEPGHPQGTKSSTAIDGLAFDMAGRTYVAERRPQPVPHHLVRTAGKTLLGRDLTTARESTWATPSARNGFPEGTAGTAITAEGAASLPVAVTPKGTLYAAVTNEQVIAVRPDGTAQHIAGSVEDAADWPEKPFVSRGRGTDVPVHLDPHSELVSDAAGNVYFVNDTYRWGFLPGSFDWTGDVSDAQRELLVTSRAERDQDTEVLQIDPDGNAATVAGHADAVAVHGEWIYLARAFHDDQGGDRVVVVRTAKR